LLISQDAKAVLGSQDVTIDLIDMLIENNQLHTDFNQEINTGIWDGRRERRRRKGGLGGGELRGGREGRKGNKEGRGKGNGGREKRGKERWRKGYMYNSKYCDILFTKLITAK